MCISVAVAASRRQRNGAHRQIYDTRAQKRRNFATHRMQRACEAALPRVEHHCSFGGLSHRASTRAMNCLEGDAQCFVALVVH